MKKTLDGRESSVLALLAQSPSLANEERGAKLLESLHGHALEIAQAIVGQSKRPSKEVQQAARGFKRWADEIE